MAQLTLPDIRVSLAEKPFRAYVKQMGDKAYHRFEQLVNPDESINSALENLRTNTDLSTAFNWDNIPMVNGRQCFYSDIFLKLISS